MKKYQILEVLNTNNNHAGSKAVIDASKIANNNNFVPIKIVKSRLKNNNIFNKVINSLKVFIMWEKIYFEIDYNSIVFIQYPFNLSKKNVLNVIRRLKKKKNVKIITLIHDIDELRFQGVNSKLNNFTDNIFFNSDVLISHNKKMKNYLISKNHSFNKIVTIDIFDYIIYNYQKNSNIDFKYRKNIIIAGNLDLKKAGYLKSLNKIKDLSFKLFGPNFSDILIGDNVEYKGSFSPELLPKYLNGGFGLVWDGDSIDYCSGYYGNYLKYNNPHKLSLYIVSGLPVIVWKKSSIATFVIEKNLGIVVNSLEEINREINKISLEDYNNMLLSVRKLGEKLRNGYYLSNVLNKGLEIIKYNNFND